MNADLAEVLAQLNQLHGNGLLTDGEFAAKRAERHRPHLIAGYRTRGGTPRESPAGRAPASYIRQFKGHAAGGSEQNLNGETMKKLAIAAAIPAIALVASALTLAPNAFAATAPATKTCTTTTTTTAKTVTVTTYKIVKGKVVATTTTKKGSPVTTTNTVCTTPPPKVTPWGVSVETITWQPPSPQNGCVSQPSIYTNVTGPATGTFADIDTSIPGVGTADYGPYAFTPHANFWAGTPGAMGGAYVPMVPGSYMVTVDIRNGATVLATSAPYKLVVPPAQTGCVQ